MRTIAAVLLIILLNQPLASANVSLTASDGSGLEMKSFKAKVVLEGLFAFTEIEMIFHNPEQRQREGRFQISLPQGAAISRFAMSRDNQLLEGEVVERKLAQRAYEDFLHRRQDPALLEVDQGNRFNARIFPIVAGENKRIIVSYSQTLNSGSYTLPLKGLPQVNEFSLRILHDANFANADNKLSLSGMSAQISSKQIVKIEQNNYKPDQDFIMPLRQKQDAMALRSGALLAARVVPFATSEHNTKHSPENWILLIDTSASQAPYIKQTLSKLAALKKRLAPKSWQVYSFDQVFRHHKADKEIDSVLALGASDLQLAFEQLKQQHFTNSRMLIVGDLVATAGETDSKKLEQLLTQVAGLRRVDVLLPSSHYDDSLAKRLRQTTNDAGVVAKLNQDLDTLVHKLMTPNQTNVAVNVLGSSWYWPKTISAIQEGEAVTIFAELPSESAVEIKVGQRSFKPQLQSSEALLLKREWARARIERLSELMHAANDRDMNDAMLQQIIKISVDERIITPYTALLVLESAADYHRYGIKPQAMADILTIDMEGVSVANRSRIPLYTAQASSNVAADKGDDIIENKREIAEKSLSETPSKTPMAKRKAMPRLRLSAPATNRPGKTAEVTAALPRASIAAKPAREAMSQDQTFSGERQVPAPSENTLARIAAETEPSAQAEMATAQKSHRISPWTGNYKTFRELLSKGQMKAAYSLILRWREQQPQDVMALIALGEYFEASDNFDQAARAYGSLLDYFPARADIRRWAAGRLLHFSKGYHLALDSLIKAVAQRPDHPSGHYLLAWTYWLTEQPDKAKTTLNKTKSMAFPRFAASHRILNECLELMNGKMKHSQLRFVLSWETDANDVDFHVRDNKGNHAFYQQPTLSSGGHLYADITTGYGPENFSINNPNNFPYKLSAHYYNMGPMGYGMGVLNIIRYHRNGKIKLEFRPFVVMTNQAFVDLGKVER